jgi:hypothetical protein
VRREQIADAAAFDPSPFQRVDPLVLTQLRPAT